MGVPLLALLISVEFDELHNVRVRWAVKLESVEERALIVRRLMHTRGLLRREADLKPLHGELRARRVTGARRAVYDGEEALAELLGEDVRVRGRRHDGARVLICSIPV